MKNETITKCVSDTTFGTPINQSANVIHTLTLLILYKQETPSISLIYMGVVRKGLICKGIFSLFILNFKTVAMYDNKHYKFDYIGLCDGVRLIQIIFFLCTSFV
jgi:hypothetical protein